MIVTLNELKVLLGIALDPDETVDADLTRRIEVATVVFEGLTKQRFREPITRTEYRDGRNRRKLFLHGHIDDEDVTASASLVVSRRAKAFSAPEWTDLTLDDDYERRDDVLIFITTWYVWCDEDEYRLVYLDGYKTAPIDVQAAVLDIAMNQYLADLAARRFGLPIFAAKTGEKLGDYSYTIDPGFVASGSTTLTDTVKKTVNRYERKFV